MKTKLLLSIALTLLFAGANAQTVSAFYNGKDIPLAKDTLAKFTLFTGKYVEGKTYLHWNVECQAQTGVYVLYRSFDNEKFEMIKSKNGIGVLISSPISYYVQDENPHQGKTWYAVVHVSKQNTLLMSDVIEVDVPVVLFSGK